MPAVVRIIQYACAAPECGATWRILPMFLARHLWRAWKTVERVVLPAGMPRSAAAPPIPPRTEQRWRARFAASARMLVVLLAASAARRAEGTARVTSACAAAAPLVRSDPGVLVRIGPPSS